MPQRTPNLPANSPKCATPQAAPTSKPGPVQTRDGFVSGAGEKTIRVRYFAVFRENAGVDEERVETSAATAGQLFDELKHRHGSREPLGHCKVAINDEMSAWDASLDDGDTVLLFPPVAGG